MIIEFFDIGWKHDITTVSQHCAHGNNHNNYNNVNNEL